MFSEGDTQGSPVPRPQTATGLWPVRNQVTQQEVSSGQVSETAFAFTAAPYRSHYHLSSGKQAQGPTDSSYGELHNYFIIYHNVIITGLPL